MSQIDSMTFKIVSDRKLEFRQNKTNKRKNNAKNKLNERLRSFIRADHILFSVFFFLFKLKVNIRVRLAHVWNSVELVFQLVYEVFGLLSKW